MQCNGRRRQRVCALAAKDEGGGSDKQLDRMKAAFNPTPQRQGFDQLGKILRILI